MRKPSGKKMKKKSNKAEGVAAPELVPPLSRCIACGSELSADRDTNPPGGVVCWNPDCPCYRVFGMPAGPAERSAAPASGGSLFAKAVSFFPDDAELAQHERLTYAVELPRPASDPAGKPALLLGFCMKGNPGVSNMVFSREAAVVLYDLLGEFLTRVK